MALGLRPSSVAQKMDTYLRELGFQIGKGDHNLYTMNNTGRIILLALYVDDLLLTGNDQEWIDCHKAELKRRFEMSDSEEEETTLYLKAECVQVPQGNFMTQRVYAKQTLELFRLANCQPVATPMTDKPQLAVDMQEECVDPTYYRSVVGKLIHLTHTRPDISYEVGIMSRYMAQPQVSHLKAAKRILRYIKGTWDFRILYTRYSNLDLEGFVDSDWAGEIESGKSTTGYVFRLAGGPVTWQSKKQPTIALSSSEAEYCSLSDSAREASWLAILIEDFGIPRPLPTIIHCDNEGSLRMALSDGINPRTRHIAAHYHFFREKN